MKRQVLELLKKLTLASKIICGVWLICCIVNAKSTIIENGVGSFLLTSILGFFILGGMAEWIFRYKYPEQQLKERFFSSRWIPLRKNKEQQAVKKEEPLNLLKKVEFDKMDGREFEMFCADVLKKNGFFDVEVTKSSGDFGVDILANKDDITYAIQCKCYSSNVGNQAVQEAYSGKNYYGKMIGAVLTNQYFTLAAEQTAARNKVLLWDREKLKELIRNADEHIIADERQKRHSNSMKDNTKFEINAHPDWKQVIKAGFIVIDRNEAVPELLVRRMWISQGEAVEIIKALEDIGLVSRASGEILMTEEIFQYKVKKISKEKENK